MKKPIFFLMFVFSFLVFASKPRSGINDLADSRGTGVENVQFTFGGAGALMKGAIDSKAVIKSFRSNIIGQYRCFSATYGGSSRATGTLYVRVTVPPGASEVAPQQIQVESKDLDAPEFIDCVKTYWSRVKFAAPVDGSPAVIVMPIRAQLRQLAAGPSGI